MHLTADLTRGNIRAQFIALMIPMILANILQQLYNSVDAMIVGRWLGQTAFAAIGVAGTLMNLFIFILNGACIGISVLFAELYGEKDWAMLRRESFLSLTAGCLFAALLSLLSLLLLPWLLRLIQTPGDVSALSAAYLRIIFLGLPATFLYNWCSAALRAAGDTDTALWVLLVSMVANVILDILFVARWNAGIEGVAVATVAAQLFSSAACLIYVKKRHPELLFGRKDMVFERALFRKTLRFGAVSALQQSSLYIGKLLVQGAVNTGGTDVISAYTAGTRVEGFANSFGDSGAAAMSVMIAQNHGARDNPRVKKSFLTCQSILGVMGFAISILMVITARQSIAIVMGKTTEPVLESACAYLTTVALFYLFNFVGSGFVGFYRGMGLIYVPVIGTLIHISIRVVLSWKLIAAMGLQAVGLATGLGWAAVVSFQTVLYILIRKKLLS